MVDEENECTACLDELKTPQEKYAGRCFDCSEKRGTPLAVDIPQFDSFEAMQKYLASQENKSKPKKKAAKVNVAKKKGRNPKPPVESEPDSRIWREIHFYVRENDTFNNVLSDAKEQKSFANEAAELFFVHNHVRGEACNEKCREQL